MEHALVELERIDDGISDPLREEIRTMVNAKYLVDKLARDPVGRRLVNSFHDSDEPRNGAEVFRDIFPFADIVHDDEPFSALVPTPQTIGASGRWTTKSLSKEEREQYLTFLQAVERALPGAYERAEYLWIKPLGLFLAHEGKNRVGFFRDMQLDWIPALVIPCRYVAAERLAIYRIDPGSDRPANWAVLDGQWLEPLRHPAWALPVLRAYGVSVHRTWPPEFPSIKLTAAALGNQMIGSASRRRSALNLPLVRRIHEFQSEEVTSSLLDIEDAKVPWRYGLWAAVISMGALIVACALPAAWSKPRICAAFVAGVASAVMLLPTLRILKLPRRLVDPHAAQRKFARKDSARARW